MGVNYVGPHISLHSGIELEVYKSARETIESTCGEGPSPGLMCKGVSESAFLLACQCYSKMHVDIQLYCFLRSSNSQQDSRIFFSHIQLYFIVEMLCIW